MNRHHITYIATFIAMLALCACGSDKNLKKGEKYLAIGEEFSKENITLCTAKNITYLSFLLLKGFRYHPKISFVLTNAMPVLSDKHIKTSMKFIEVSIYL